MTNSTLSPFQFDFSSVSIGGNEIDSFSYNVPLAATITAVAYKNLAKKDSGEENIKLVITQDVFEGDKVAQYDTIISAKQAYLLKSYMVACGVDANALSNQVLDEDGLKSELEGKTLIISFETREWQGRTFRNVKKIAPYVDATESDMPF